MNHLSSHILDLARGKPVADVPVRVERQDTSGGWLQIASARTDREGRCAQLLPQGEFPAGFYRLIFDTASYFRALKIAALHPVVEVTFEVREEDERFHLPLLLTPNGYTTYRGN
jgi:5-hydroxyisourate hydrolase